MDEIFKSHPFAVSIVGGVSLAVVSVLLCHVALWAWDCLSDFSLRGLFHRKYRKVCPRANCHAFDAARERLRAELLAGGYGEHNAYHIMRNGFVIFADAADYYFALFTGMDDFWDYVALGRVGEPYGGFLTAPLEQIDFRDGKGAYARIHAASGETFVDSDVLAYTSNSYLCTRATADEFKKAIVERQAEAAKRAKGDGRVEDGFGVHVENYTTST